MTLRYSLLGSLLFPLMVLGAPAKDTPLAPPLQVLKDQGFDFKQPFDVAGLQGYVVEYQGQGTTVFLTPDKQHAIVGNMVDNQGHNLSEPQIDKYVYAPMTKVMWERLEKSHYISAGSGPRIVYAFFDPFCPYCSDFWEKAKPWMDSGKVQLRVLLVSILRRDSSKRSASLLLAKDPSKALSDYEDTHWKIYPPEPATVPDNVKQILKDNVELMRALSSDATPSIYYNDASGRLQQQLGLPNDETMQIIMGGKP